MTDLDESEARWLERSDDYYRVAGTIIRNRALLELTLVFYLMIFLGMNDQFRARLIWASLPNFQARRKLLADFPRPIWTIPCFLFFEDL